MQVFQSRGKVCNCEIGQIDIDLSGHLLLLPVPQPLVYFGSLKTQQLGEARYLIRAPILVLKVLTFHRLLLFLREPPAAVMLVLYCISQRLLRWRPDNHRIQRAANFIILKVFTNECVTLLFE